MKIKIKFKTKKLIIFLGLEPHRSYPLRPKPRSNMKLGSNNNQTPMFIRSNKLVQADNITNK